MRNRLQILLIDMYLLEVCNMYQGDRKVDNWLIEVISDKDPNRNHLGLLFTDNIINGTRLFVKIGDPEQITFMRDSEKNQYKTILINDYFNLGSKLGQYSFNLLNTEFISSSFFETYLKEIRGFNDNQLQLLSSKYELKNIIKKDNIYDLIKDHYYRPIV